MENRWVILASVACGTFMATLDSSIVNIALPSITNALQTNLSYSRWVVISYLFSITGLLLFFGKLADVIGRKLVFNTGFIIFTLGCLFCGLAESINELIFSRGIQGFGAAMIMANGPAIITAAFPANERGKALGTLAMFVSAGLAVGPSLGGWLVRFFGWQSIFFINMPFSILGGFLVYKNVPSNLGMSETSSGLEITSKENSLPLFARIQICLDRLQYFDWLGAILWLFIQLGYSLAIDRDNVLGLGPSIQKIVSFGSAALLFLFLIWESSISNPILNLALFKSRQFLFANISALFNFMAISAITLLTPFYLQQVKHMPPHKVGMLMTAIPMSIFFIAPIAGRLSDRYGARVLSTVGMLVICLSMFGLGIPNHGIESSSIVELTLYLIAIGLGIGLFQSPNNNSIMSCVEKEHLGVASALLATIRNFGLVSGVALSTSLLISLYGKRVSLQVLQGDPGIDSADLFTVALRHTFIALSAICALGIITSLVRGSKEAAKI